MVMTREGLCILPLVLRVPYFDEEIGGACDWWNEKLVGREKERKNGTEEMTSMVKVEVHDSPGVALEGTLKLARFPVPYLDGCVLACRGDDGVLGVEGDAGDGCSMAGEDVCGGCARYPVGLRGCAFGGSEGEFFLEGGVAIFEVHDLGEDERWGLVEEEKELDLLLETDDAGPLLFEEAGILCFWIWGVLNACVGLERVVCVGEVVGIEVVEHRLVPAGRQ